VLAAAFDGVKREVEAVVSATEAFKTEAILNMQVLRADVQKVQVTLSQLHLQNLGTVGIKNTRDKKIWGQKSCTKKENTKTIEREKL
jgi:hypothetical protein